MKAYEITKKYVEFGGVIVEPQRLVWDREAERYSVIVQSNGEEQFRFLSEEQIENLIKAGADWIAEVQGYEPDIDEKYFTIECGQILACKWQWSDVDRLRLEQGNVYKTIEEAKHIVDMIVYVMKGGEVR